MKRSLTIAALSGLLFVAAGCGSDDDAGSAADETTATAAEADSAEGAGSDATDAAAPEATAADDVEATSDTRPEISIDLSDISLPEGLSAECTAYATAIMGAMAGIGTGAEVDADAIAEAFGKLESLVPDDLKDDVATMAEAWGPFAELLNKFDGDIAAMMADPEAMAALGAMDTPEVTAADDALSAYFDEVCPDTDLGA